MRPGDNAKLAPEAEQAHLDALRAEREAKAHIKLQAEAQALAMTLGALELNAVPAKSKELGADKKFGGATMPAAMAIMLNTVLRNGVPPKEEEATPRGGKKGGGNKRGSSVKPTKNCGPAAADGAGGAQGDQGTQAHAQGGWHRRRRREGSAEGDGVVATQHPRVSGASRGGKGHRGVVRPRPGERGGADGVLGGGAVLHRKGETAAGGRCQAR